MAWGGPLGRITVRSITRKLHRADRELTIAADLSEAQVVPHTWGIIDEDEPWLVAKVDRIIPEDPQNELLTVTKGVLNYNLSRRWRRLGLADITPRQFVRGSNLNSPDHDPAVFLVDIEPWFRLPLPPC